MNQPCNKISSYECDSENQPFFFLGTCLKAILSYNKILYKYFLSQKSKLPVKSKVLL